MEDDLPEDGVIKSKFDQDSAPSANDYLGRMRDALKRKILRPPPRPKKPEPIARGMSIRATRLTYTAVGLSLLLLAPTSSLMLHSSEGTLSRGGMPFLIPLMSSAVVMVVTIIRIRTQPKR